MGDAMDIDSTGVQDDSVNGSNAALQQLESNDVAHVALDKVSLLQESVDKMALSMFNALRLLPANASDASTKEETATAIRSLANDVLRMVKETDALIDDLPGLDKTESDQLEELRRLQIQSDEEAQTLRQVAEEAERWMERARDSLRVVSESRLRR